jgi:enterochelin esterase-like enzyme
VSVKRVKRQLIILLFLLLAPAGCMTDSFDASSEAVVLPPAQSLPTGIAMPTEALTASAAPTAAATPAVITEKIPTAIARGITAIFSRAEPTSTPTALPTLSSIPSPTAVVCAGEGQIVTGTFQSETAGVMPYRIYLPPCYGEGGRVYPTLYMLPGNIHTDSGWDDLGLDEAAEEAMKQGEIPPFLIVMASGGYYSNFTSGGPYSYETVIMEDLIPYIEGEYCAWPDAVGRAIGGMSRGGYWSLEIAFRNADQFVSVGGHSASLYDLYGGPDVVPQSTGLTNDLGELRIYFDVGENDWVIPNLEKLHIDMEEAGIEHEWVVNEGWHENAYWAEHVQEYIRWYGNPWSKDRASYPLCRLQNGGESE